MDSPPKDYDNNDGEQQESLYDEFGQKIIKIRELTILEKEYFEKARRKHKQNIFREQVVQGKTYKGQGFLSKPAEINFKDFDVGRQHTIVLQLTNVSFTFNSFKILPLKESICDFFDIIYTPPGRISAGMNCPITIKFTPQLNEDIYDQLEFLAETGPFSIPILCTCKKAVAKCDIIIIDFGDVIFGEDSSSILKIQNQGALDTEVQIKSLTGNDIQTKTEGQSMTSSMKKSQIFDEDRQTLDKQLSQLKFQKVHVLKGYSQLNISIKYIPNEIGQFNLQLQVYFENFLHSPPIIITIRGNCIEVPIYVEKEIYDFQICLFNHIYREKIVFHNRGTNSMKIQMIQPKESKQFFEFNTKLGFIQGKSHFEIWVKFNADKELTNICQNYINEDIIEMPFKLIGADQKMPVQFKIRIKMSTSSLQITPGKLEFGKVFEGQASRQSLIFDNLSDLPQELIIYPLPKEIEIAHDIIPIKLLPKQKFQTQLIFRSSKQVGVDNDRTEDGHLRCKIITGTIATKEIRIPYICQIMKCPLQFSVLKLQIPSLQIDEQYFCTISIKNTSQRDIILEFFLPYEEISGLAMTPMVQTLTRETQAQFHLEFKSFFKKLGAYTLQNLKDKYENDINYNFKLRLKKKYEEQEKQDKQLDENKNNDDQQGKGTKKQEKKEVKKEAKPQQLTKVQQQQLEIEQQRQAELEKLRLEEDRQKREEMERNFNSEKELLRLGGKLLEFGESPENQNYSQHYTWLVPCYFKYIDQQDSQTQVIYIQIDTVSVQKSLVLSKSIIDFGEIAVGISQTKSIIITNNTDKSAEMKMQTLPISCGFTILNALRCIEPGQNKNIVVQFQPSEEQQFEQILQLFCKHTAVSVKLKGNGVRPEVKLEPEQGLLNFGGVVLGEFVEKSFKITNVSNFAIKFELASQSAGTQNIYGTEVFSFIPSQGVVTAKQQLIVKVIFKPDRISDKFFELISINVPNQKDEKRLFVWGSCYNRQAYVNIHSLYSIIPQPQALNQKLESPFDLLRIKDEDKIYSPSNTKIILEFARTKDDLTQQADECYQRKIVIGNCKMLDPKSEKAVGYEIFLSKDNQSNYFACDNLKGNVVAGNESTITFTFKPPQIDQFIANIEALQKIGQWKEVKADLKISGGFIKANTSDTWQFEILLRAFINSI